MRKPSEKSGLLSSIAYNKARGRGGEQRKEARGRGEPSQAEQRKEAMDGATRMPVGRQGRHISFAAKADGDRSCGLEKSPPLLGFQMRWNPTIIPPLLLFPNMGVGSPYTG
jgi:hypothetical protein